MSLFISSDSFKVRASINSSDNKTDQLTLTAIESLKHLTFHFNEHLLIRPCTFIPSSPDLIGELIKIGKYETEDGDSTTPTKAGPESIGENQGTKATRRLYLEILKSGIDLFNDENLNRIKKGNPKLYKNILIKTSGHVFSEDGFVKSINKEGSCEALSMLMLVHSLREMRFIINNIVNDANNKLVRQIEDQKTIRMDVLTKLYNQCCDYFYSIDVIELSKIITMLEQYVSTLNEIEVLLGRAVTAESTDEEILDACNLIKRNHTQIVCSGYDWHSEVLIFRLREIVYHNRGANKENGKEIQSAPIDNSSVSLGQIRYLSNRHVITRPHISSPAFEAAKSGQEIENTFEIQLKTSKGGHCTHAATKAAVYSIFAAKHTSEKPYIAAKGDYKGFTKYHRKSFARLFRKHPIE